MSSCVVNNVTPSSCKCPAVSFKAKVARPAASTHICKTSCSQITAWSRCRAWASAASRTWTWPTRARTRYGIALSAPPPLRRLPKKWPTVSPCRARAPPSPSRRSITSHWTASGRTLLFPRHRRRHQSAQPMAFSKRPYCRRLRWRHGTAKATLCFRLQRLTAILKPSSKTRTKIVVSCSFSAAASLPFSVQKCHPITCYRLQTSTTPVAGSSDWVLRRVSGVCMCVE